jgi:hypothetical protein
MMSTNVHLANAKGQPRRRLLLPELLCSPAIACSMTFTPVRQTYAEWVASNEVKRG